MNAGRVLARRQPEGPGAVRRILTRATPAANDAPRRSDPLQDYSPELAGLPQWSLAEMRLLQKLATSGWRDQDIRRRLGKSRKDVRNAKFHLGISPQKPGRWTSAQDELLTVSFWDGGLKHCLANNQSGHSPEETQRRLICLGLVPGRDLAWHPWEVRYLRQAVARHAPLDEIAYSLIVSREVIIASAREQGCTEADIEAVVRPRARLALHDAPKTAITQPAESAQA